MEEGKYIYCIFNSIEEKEFGPLGIGERGNTLNSVAFRDIAALVSDTPVKEYPVSRANLMAHQKAIELLMDSYTILPVRFGTIAKASAESTAAERIKYEVLEKRYPELTGLLKQMEGKIELGVKCLWTDMEPIFTEIVEENSDIKILKQRLSRGDLSRTSSGRIALGEKVKNALDGKRLNEEARILRDLKPLSIDLKSGLIYGDNMVTNSSFLVSKDRVKEYDAVVNQLSSEFDGRIKLKYVGPVPPYNFVELTIIID